MRSCERYAVCGQMAVPGDSMCEGCRTKNPKVLVWERLDDYHERARVYGGWLVKASETVAHQVEGRFDIGYDWRVSMCFVPDPDHRWNISGR